MARLRLLVTVLAALIMIFPAAMAAYDQERVERPFIIPVQIETKPFDLLEFQKIMEVSHPVAGDLARKADSMGPRDKIQVLLQFKGTVQDTDRMLLEGIGARLILYSVIYAKPPEFVFC